MTPKDIRRINKKLRAKDDSHLWPICSQFNATDRAIRRIRDQQRQGLVIDDAYSYEAVLEAEISRIVNNTGG